MDTVSEKWKQVGWVEFSIKADLLLMVALSLMVVSFEKLMQILKRSKEQMKDIKIWTCLTLLFSATDRLVEKQFLGKISR